MNTKEIGAMLDLLAELHLDESYSHEKVPIYSDGHFQISCIPGKPHIKEVAKKYKKGFKSGTRQMKDWGVWGTRLSRKIIEKRYAGDPDMQQFLDLLCN